MHFWDLRIQGCADNLFVLHVYPWILKVQGYTGNTNNTQIIQIKGQYIPESLNPTKNASQITRKKTKKETMREQWGCVPGRN